MKKKTFYLHTLDGSPAGYSGKQICFAASYGKAVALCSSLREIRMQQRFSEQWRRKQGLDTTEPNGYGYRRVVLP